MSILRRLSLHALTGLEHNSLTPDAKLEWLLEKVGIYDPATEGEVVASLQALYSQASEIVRYSVVRSVSSHEEHWSNLSLEENERLNACLHLRWLKVLEAVASSCPHVQDALEHIFENYPQLRENRQLRAGDQFYESAPMLFPSLWIVDELLRHSGQTLANELSLQLEQEESGIVRDRALEVVKEAAKIRPQWGYELAEALAGADNWNTILWVPLLDSWSQQVYENFHVDVLRLLTNGEVGQTFSKSAADVLCSLVDDGGVPYALSLLPYANQFAALLWPSCTDAEVAPELKEDDWLSDPLAHPAGTLAKFWTQSLSIWYELQEPKPRSLPPEYLTPLSTILEDDTLAGQVGLMALAECVQLLMDVDEAWCLDSLIPVFWQSESRKFRFAWHGLTRISLSTCVADKLQDAFLYAASNLNELFP